MQPSNRNGFTCASENTGIGTLWNAFATNGNTPKLTIKYKTRKEEVLKNPLQSFDSVRLLMNLCVRKESKSIIPPTCVRKVNSANKMSSKSILSKARKIFILFRGSTNIFSSVQNRNFHSRLKKLKYKPSLHPIQD